MKKLLTSLTALSMLALAACGGGASQQASQPAAGKPTKQEAPATQPAGSGEKKVLEFWYKDPGEMEKIFLETVDKFEEKHPDVELKALRIPNDAYKQKLAVSMSGGNPPDIFVSWGGGWLKAFAEAGNVLDITGKFDESRFNKLALNNTIFNDKVYGLPLAISLTHFYYNKEIFAKYNLTPPKTWDELVNAIETLKKNNVIPIALANKTKWPGAYYLMYFADRIGSEKLFLDAFHRNGRGFDDPEYVKAGEYIQKLVDMEAFNPGFNGVPWDAGQGRQLMYSGQAAMLLISNSFINNIRDENPEYEKKVDFFPFPSIPGGKGDPTNLGVNTSPVWSVSSTSKYPDLAVEFINDLTSVETAQAFADRTGYVTTINGVNYSDPIVKKLAEQLEKANAVHFPYDQTIPPELAELHKDTTQAIFGKSMTPEEAAKQMEAKAKTILDK
ncbi:extracellular solute-binding protein [Ammoniphilus resinae]|uniref:Raffinose/stachyose/melibiose transport system substrate-binding protein n=1 Tax=Ammoniphilus resinae TaxID=861532 RepID=A0ABS4GM68_9BACL|nr:extracellular solute-binding protein [Ammoniphilus resinae]MBP1931341.1 raffinose/stachyose/melibiose transport system substrate-binding protein [Ammoniphilus resinae]